VIAGRGDQLIAPAAQRTMADAIPEAHFTQLPDAGHLAPLEQPVNTGRVIGEFLEALP
jgi:pimeloyl-ACP methyl ester carboxylesterase